MVDAVLGRGTSLQSTYQIHSYYCWATYDFPIYWTLTLYVPTSDV